MVDGGCFPVHQARGSDDFAAEMLSNRLVPEANTEDGHFAGKGLNDAEADTRLVGRAWAGRNEDALGLEGLGFLCTDGVVSINGCARS